ncbi:MAG: hypothetical protein IPL26_08080 [Leptospiraceae bacterium]|nr:hypothetical protein [Leptospiraceae bacterium]
MEIVLVFIQNIPKRVCGISILATMPIIFFTSSSIYSQVNPDSFKKDTILLGEKNYIQSEYNIQKDSIFLRNAKIGKIVPKSKVKDIVSDEYFTKIKDTSRLAAISESFYLFSSQTGSGTEMGRVLLFQGFLSTKYESCQPHTFNNTLSFTDPKGDVKAGVFQFLQPEQGLRDLVSGTIENTEDQLKLTFGLSSIPISIRLSNSGQRNIPEYKWVYEFKSPSNELTVGIVLYSNGISEIKSMQAIPTEIFENKNSISSCGHPTVSSSSIFIVCDLQSIPILRELNSEYTFNVFVESYDNQSLYRDCY